LVKISRNSMLKNRVQKLRAEVRIDTQKLRNQAIENLQELFTLAKEQAQNTNIKLKQRQSWARVAAYICQVINTIAAHFDERQIDVDLNKLEELINETTTKKKAQKS
jgi:ribosomal protein L17